MVWDPKEHSDLDDNDPRDDELDLSVSDQWIRLVHEGVVEGAKRQHFPATIHWTCPRCGTEREHEYQGDWYLSYPKLTAEGVEETHELYCEECYDEVATVTLKPKLTLELTKVELITKD